MGAPVALIARLFSSIAASAAKFSPQDLTKLFERLGVALQAKKFTDELVHYLGKMGGKASVPVVSKDQFNAMSQNINNIIDIQKKEHVEDELIADLPFHTDTLFLVLLVIIAILIIAFVVWLFSKYSHARNESAPQRAAKLLNIETGGIGAPKHIISPVSIPMTQGCV